MNLSFFFNCDLLTPPNFKLGTTEGVHTMKAQIRRPKSQLFIIGGVGFADFETRCASVSWFWNLGVYQNPVSVHKIYLFHLLVIIVLKQRHYDQNISTKMWRKVILLNYWTKKKSRKKAASCRNIAFGRLLITRCSVFVHLYLCIAALPRNNSKKKILLFLHLLWSFFEFPAKSDQLDTSNKKKLERES